MLNHSLYAVLPEGSRCLTTIEHMTHLCFKGQQSIPFLQLSLDPLSLRNVADNATIKCPILEDGF